MPAAGKSAGAARVRYGKIVSFQPFNKLLFDALAKRGEDKALDDGVCLKAPTCH
jgi:hypothetical protein